MNEIVNRRALFVRVKQVAQFCIVGGSGVVVDMAVLFLLADQHALTWCQRAVKTGQPRAVVSN